MGALCGATARVPPAEGQQQSRQVREKLFATRLNSLYGTPEHLGVLISITGFALVVLWGLIGGVVNIFYRPGDGSHTPLDEIEQQVEEIESQIESEERAA